MYDQIKKQAESAMKELIEAAGLRAGDLVVIGCSSSEIAGGEIGRASSPEAAKAVFDAIAMVIEQSAVCIAAQCCEHLNRALIVERETAKRFGYDEVCVRPRPDAGGWFATTVYESMLDPVAVERIRAKAGIDIGGTLIGMHLKEVAVPLRLKTSQIGAAHVHAAKTRPKLIGGARADYPDEA